MEDGGSKDLRGQGHKLGSSLRHEPGKYDLFQRRVLATAGLQDNIATRARGHPQGHSLTSQHAVKNGFGRVLRAKNDLAADPAISPGLPAGFVLLG